MTAGDPIVRLDRVSKSFGTFRVLRDVSFRIEPGQMVVLVVVTDRGNITVKGEILWCEIDSLQIDAAEDHYLSGVAFRHEIAGIKMVIDDLRSRDLAILIEDNRDHDRYRVSAPLTGRFGQVEPVSVLDLSMRGARIATEAEIEPEMEGRLSFQIDEENGTTEVDARVIWTAPAISGGQFAGLLIPDHDEIMRKAIHRLCTRGEARIDLDSLRRKFDQLRAQWPKQSVAG